MIKKTNKIYGYRLIVAIITVLLLIGLAPSVLATDAITLQIDSVQAPTTAGTIISIPIKATDVGNIVGIGFKINYDRTKLEFAGWDGTGSVFGTTFNIVPVKSTTTDVNTNNLPPAFAYTSSNSDIMLNDFGVSGTGILANIKFKVLVPGAAEVSFSTDNGAVSVDGINGMMNVNKIDGGLTQTAVSVTGVTLDKSNTTIQAGATDTLTAIVSPSNASDKTVTWISSDTSVATVNNGVVTGVASGTATIAVTSNADPSKTATCTVIVTAESMITLQIDSVETPTTAGTIISIPIKATDVGNIVGIGFKINYDRTKLEFAGWDGTGSVFGTTFNIVPVKSTTTDVNTNNLPPAFAYTSSNSDIMLNDFGVSGTGILANIKFKVLVPGAAVVSFSTDNGAVSVDGINGIMNVNKIDGGLTQPEYSLIVVTLDKSNTTIQAGATDTLTAIVSPSNASDKTVSWTSSDTSVATVNNGVVTGVAPGTATITVTSNADPNMTATSTVTVTASSLENPLIDLSTVTFDKKVSNRANIVVNLTYNNNSLIGIFNGAAQLVLNQDYTVNGTVVTISKDYLKTLTKGIQTLTFSFSAGTPPSLGITVINTSRYGDINRDGVVDNKDLVLFKRYFANVITSFADADNADVNGDGSLDNKDLVLVKRFFANVINSFPADLQN